MRIQIQYKGAKKIRRTIKRTRSGLTTHVQLKLYGQKITNYKGTTTMEVKRIQSFSATINGVEFVNERRFDVVEYILHLIEYEFGIEVTTQFVEDLDELVGDLRLASELTFADIEIILRDCVLESKSFDTLQFNIEYLDDCTDYINEQLASGAYKTEV